MKKLCLMLALGLTTCNLAIGVTYAAICRGSNGARACGAQCTTLPAGDCGCSGACTKEERDWVAGAGASGDDEAAMEIFDY